MRLSRLVFSCIDWGFKMEYPYLDVRPAFAHELDSHLFRAVRVEIPVFCIVWLCDDDTFLTNFSCKDWRIDDFIGPG